MCLNPAQKSSRLTATFGFERTCFPVFKRSCRGKTLLKIILLFLLVVSSMDTFDYVFFGYKRKCQKERETSQVEGLEEKYTK